MANKNLQGLPSSELVRVITSPNPDIDRELCLALNLRKEVIITGSCDTCHCLKVAHHGPGIGCEGAGGNCGCVLDFGHPSGPPPDLISDSGFVLLRNALLMQGYEIESWKQVDHYYCQIARDDPAEPNITKSGPDEKAALRAAAHALLCPKEKP